MKFKCEYADLICPVCGGRVKHYFDCNNREDCHYFYYNICEDCHYILTNSNIDDATIYGIKDSGTDTAYGNINSEDLIPNSLVIHNCELIKLHHKELDIEFEFDTRKLENINTIEINGHRFVRDKE